MNGCFVVSSMIAVRRLRLFAKYFFSLERFSLLLLLLFDTFRRRDTEDDKKAHHRSVKKESERNALRDENSLLHFSFSLTRLNALSLS
jgi:hypothetical protein